MSITRTLAGLSHPLALVTGLAQAMSSDQNLNESEEKVAAFPSRHRNAPAAQVGDEHFEALRVVLNHVTEAILMVNASGVIEMINPAGAQLIGAPREALIGQTWTRHLSRPYKAEYEALFADWRKSKESQLNHGPKEVLFKRMDGEFIECDLSWSCLPGEKPMFIGIIHNLTTHKAEYRELRRLARTDSLTGLANRRAFDEVLQRNWTDAVNHNLPLSVIIIDVDYFKHFNDQYGHIQGDYCLRKIAEVIEQALPSRRCLAARYGGEEFAAILPGCTAEMAATIARQIQKRVKQLNFSDQGLSSLVRVTVSQGIACEHQHQFRTATALLCSADTALYRAKSAGRDGVNCA
ncbi:diguanylate cyclase [Simiduia curdlanivorans]|uniref:diguanylate cyclase n=1 Tax=Simiduia curdlanivorans TaxID=1492769 RepID=A0ABV8V658_9GAMM|nr:sensor domain-containing diguanylate cyclase [Simiduia curdlanivorans]MDN3640280.1 diguanylate cyclase [Simiduia curdlanivorans]